MENLGKADAWRTVRILGKGSFATVYEIVRTDALGEEEHAALKVISIPTTATEIAAQRDDGMDDVSITAYYQSQVQEITREFKLMAQMKGHSNIVSYEDHGVQRHQKDPGWDILIRMELLASLPDYYRANFEANEIREDVVIRLGIDICKALELCEKYKVIHRDIKPQNIFISRNGDFKLGDFGIARVAEKTTKATKAGTYGYMAPEVYCAQPYNASVDIYSLGLVMHWMLNKRRGPFLPLPPDVPTAEQNTAALQARMSGRPIPAPFYGSLALHNIILKACAFSPADRYHSPKEMRQALETLSSGEWLPGVIPIGGVSPTQAASPVKKKENQTELADSGSTLGHFPSPVTPTFPGKAIYRVVFRNENGEILSDREYLEGDPMDVIRPADWEDSKYRYEFVGWKPSPGSLVVNKSEVYTAQYKKRRKKSRVPLLIASAAAVVALAAGGVAATKLLHKTPAQATVSSSHDQTEQQYTEAATGIQFQSEGSAASFSVQPLSAADDDYQTLLQDGYACIGFYDIKISGLQGAGQIIFPVDSHYEGTDVEIAHISDTGMLDITAAEVENGAVTVAATSSSPYLLQVKPEMGKDWSQWTDQLPANISADDYVIESALLSRSREKETTTSQKQALSGWTLEDTILEETGEDTGWLEAPLEDPPCEPETKTQYQAVERETMTSSSSTLSGWTYEKTTYEWSEYGPEQETTLSIQPSESCKVETRTEYSFLDKEYTESNQASLAGWTRYGERTETAGAVLTSSTAVQAYENESGRREVKKEHIAVYKTQYHYYRYYGPNGNCPWTFSSSSHPNYEEIWVDEQLPFLRHSGGIDQFGSESYRGEANSLYWLECRGSDYSGSGDWTRTVDVGYDQYSYQDFTYTYHFYRWNENNWSEWTTTPIYETEDRKVRERTISIYKERTKIPTYHFYRETTSDWSDTPITQTTTRSVNTRTLYRYPITDTIYHFWRWPDTWSDWSFTAPAESEDVQVETAVCYRYCRKT